MRNIAYIAGATITLVMLMVISNPTVLIPILYIIGIGVSYAVFTYYEEAIAITSIKSKALLSAFWPFAWTAYIIVYMVEDFPTDLYTKLVTLDKKLKRKK